MRKKRTPNFIKEQRLRERFTNSKNRKNDPTSAYWDFGLHSFGIEDVTANPDQLPQEAAMYQPPDPLTEEQEAQAEAYYKLVDDGGLASLTEQERTIWEKAFIDWKEPSDIAKELKITIQAVYSAIKRAGRKIKKILKERLNETKEII